MSFQPLEPNDWARCEHCTLMVPSRIAVNGVLVCRDCAGASRCECEDPGCPAHSEDYSCDLIAIGTLTDSDLNPMNYCAECAAAALTTLEFTDVAWERHYD